MSDAIPEDIRRRIVDAAEELATSTGKVPTVDAVRRKAGTDMNAAAAVMRDWRAARSHAASAPAIQVPEAVASAAAAAAAQIWKIAEQLAGEALVNARAAWVQDRSEADALREEIAQAYGQLEADLVQMRDQLTKACAAEARVAEELAQAQQARLQLDAQLDAERSRLKELRDELDAARAGERQARDDSARLQGKLEALEQRGAR